MQSDVFVTYPPLVDASAPSISKLRFLDLKYTLILHATNQEAFDPV